MKYTAKKLFLGNHKLDNGKTWSGAGWATVNEHGEIHTTESLVTHGTFIDVFQNKYAAKKNAKAMNKEQNDH